MKVVQIMLTDHSKKNNKLLIYIFTMACTLVFIAKIFIVEDISLSDEAHMFATSFRIFQGDALLVDDWSPEQLYGVVLLPFIAIYHFFVGSNEGLFLFLRFVFIVLKLTILIYGFRKVKYVELNPIGLYLGLFLWYFFVSWNIESLTYQQMTLILGMFIIIGILANSTNKFEYILMGIAYALSILTQPFLIISYVPVLIYAVYKIMEEKKIRTGILFFNIGAFWVFVLFMILLLSRSSISEIKISLPYILSEPDHNVAGGGIFGLINTKIIRVFKIFIDENKVTTALNTVFLMVLSVAFIVNWRYRLELKILIPVVLLISISSMIPANKLFFMNEMYIPFIWASIENLFFVKNKRYYIFLALGYIFVFSIALGTNTGKYTTSGALSIIAVITIFFIDYGSNDHKKMRKICIIIPMILITGLALFLRVYVTWWGVPLSKDCYKNRIVVGPMKGLYANDAEYDHYMNIYVDICSVDFNNDILFCGTATPMAYLIAEAKYGTMGTPFFYLDYDRLQKYWDLHPDRKPTVIYYEKYTSEDARSFINDMISKDFEIRTEGSRFIAVKREG